jgi:hypothetical protein
MQLPNAATNSIRAEEPATAGSQVAAVAGTESLDVYFACASGIVIFA